MKSERGKKQQLPCRIHTRLTQEKFNELTDILSRSRSLHSHSELLRYILDNKPIIIQNRDAATDMVMEELSGIHKELKAMGININQVTKVLHQLELPEDKLFQAKSVIKFLEKTDLRINELFSILNKLSEKWLPA